MKRTLVLVAGIALLSSACEMGKKVNMEDKKQKVSYAIGMDIGTRIKSQQLEIDPNAFAQGFKAKYEDKDLLLKDEEVQQVLMDFQKELFEKRDAEQKQAGEKNKEDGDKFLADNKAKEGIVTTESGLQYQVVEEGKGKTPKATDKVKVHYRGTLLDGSEFDSSYARNSPATFPVNAVIPGWTEALQKMKVGSKWKLFIPSELGYGDRGSGPKIGPHATLIFDVELLEIVK